MKRIALLLPCLTIGVQLLNKFTTHHDHASRGIFDPGAVAHKFTRGILRFEAGAAGCRAAAEARKFTKLCQTPIVPTMA
jgi:hypothetical protein